MLLKGNVVLEWGDVRIRADRMIFDPQQNQGEATGNVVVQRGDEILRGERFIFDSVAGQFRAQSAVALSPPFSVEGVEIVSDADGIQATQAIVTLGREGSSEIVFRADTAQLVSATRRLVLRNARLSLFGVRLFTLPRLSVPLSFENADSLERRNAAPPVTFRASQISGVALGIGLNSTLAPRTFASFAVEQTTRQGTQGLLAVRYGLIGGPIGLQTRRDVPLPGGVPPELADATPLRRLLTARPLPPPFDPVLDFVDISAIPNLLSEPTRYGNRDAFVAVTLAEKREFAGRRQGPLLLSRHPEAQFVWNMPLAGPLPVRDNDATRQELRRVRLTLSGDLSTGRYVETRTNEDNRTIRRTRNGLTFGVGTLPVLVGKNVLLTGTTALYLSEYGSDTYRFLETSVAAQWVLGRRQGIGLAYIQRGISGNTPFFFDSVDTQNEAQIRGLLPLNHRYTVSLVGRYDTAQGTLFDYEVTVVVRGNVLEPRFFYRRLNGQVGFTIGVPGLVGL
ncbi:MAG: hypothetical protein OHK0029_00270 [Armatimonadaceae bacterium]